MNHKREILLSFIVIFISHLIINCEAQSSWQFIDKDYEFRAVGVSFYSELDGWMAGMKYYRYVPLLLHTTDGGQSYENDPYVAEHGGYVTIDFEDSQNGLAAGLDFFGLDPCAVMTTNGGQNWTTVKSGHDFICTCQSTQVLNSGSTFVMAAQWIELLDFQGDGLQISTDGGKNWNSRNWNMGTEARYVSCVGGTCFVAGGTWAFPNTPSKSETLRKIKNNEPVDEFYFTHHIKIDKDGKATEILENSMEFERINITEFKAIVAMTTDNGKTWTVSLNVSAQGLYFNEISCVDANHCWVVGTGVISQYNTTRAAWIYATADGGQTWTEQLHWNAYSLVDIQMLNTTFGWAAGTQMLTATDWQGIFLLTTDGGTTWVPSGALHKFSPMNLSVVDVNYAYAAGLTSPDFSSLVGYVPS